MDKWTGHLEAVDKSPGESVIEREILCILIYTQ